MKTQHTPGPWRLDKVDNDWAVVGAANADTLRSSFIIAGIYSIVPVNTVEGQEANARLIAAAPELLETLKRVRDWSVDVMKPGWSVMMSDVRKLNADVVAAIAKAEGK